MSYDVDIERQPEAVREYFAKLGTAPIGLVTSIIFVIRTYMQPSGNSSSAFDSPIRPGLR
jgi:hypothetical protein